MLLGEQKPERQTAVFGTVLIFNAIYLPFSGLNKIPQIDISEKWLTENRGEMQKGMRTREKDLFSREMIKGKK